MTPFPYITKTDFAPYAQISTNIEDRFVTLAVNKAYNLDVLPVLNDTMLGNIYTYLAASATWVNTTAYVVGNKVKYSDRYYTCLIANTGSTPSPTNANWSETELMAFYVDFIKPYFVMSAYSRFLLWHGANITQYGARQNNEDTSAEISDKRRGELLAETKELINVYLSNLNTQFNTVSGTFDGTNYPNQCCDNNLPTRGGYAIWGVGYPNTVNKKKKNNCCDYDSSEYL